MKEQKEERIRNLMMKGMKGPLKEVMKELKDKKVKELKDERMRE